MRKGFAESVDKLVEELRSAGDTIKQSNPDISGLLGRAAACLKVQSCKIEQQSVDIEMAKTAWRMRRQGQKSVDDE
jgi:hypothetical protein